VQSEALRCRRLLGDIIERPLPHPSQDDSTSAKPRSRIDSRHRSVPDTCFTLETGDGVSWGLKC
jgi:hypothetical protein